jgi:hypothetical protein
MGSGLTLKICQKLSGYAPNLYFFSPVPKIFEIFANLSGQRSGLLGFLAIFGPVWIRPKRQMFAFFVRIGIRHFLLLPGVLFGFLLRISAAVQ